MFMELLLMQNFNFSKTWVKNQGIQPHTDRMPPCGCIARLYRRQLVDGEFLHRNGRISIVWYWWFGDEKRTQGGSVCRCSGFSRPSFDSYFFCHVEAKVGFWPSTVEILSMGPLPGFSYLVLRIKPMVPGGRPIISIGYKCNARKVLYFIMKDNVGRT